MGIKREFNGLGLKRFCGDGLKMGADDGVKKGIHQVEKGKEESLI